VELRVAGGSIPYSIYDKLGTVDQGTIVDNKRLGHVLQIVQHVQSKRDDRIVRAPSTGHRADGTLVPRHQIAGTKRQRQLGPEDVHEAIGLSRALVR
jgi:hypothetical protein